MTKSTLQGVFLYDQVGEKDALLLIKETLSVFRRTLPGVECAQFALSSLTDVLVVALEPIAQRLDNAIHWLN